MADEDENPQASDEQPLDADTEHAAADPARERIWDSPIGAGEPIPFDPTRHKPPLSPEEVEKLLGEEQP
jgi:hypothetical protein